MIFPKWLYHETKEAKIFKNEEEVKKAGEGWVNSPVELKKEEIVANLSEEKKVISKKKVSKKVSKKKV